MFSPHPSLLTVMESAQSPLTLSLSPTSPRSGTRCRHESRANIDHIAVTAAGIWVIDAKRYAGRPQVKASGGLFRPRVQKLYVGSRDCTSLVDGVLTQAAQVQAAMADIPVHPVLCFVDSDWDLLAGPIEISGVSVTTPRRLKGALSKETEGPFPVTAMAKAIAAGFPPA